MNQQKWIIRWTEMDGEVWQKCAKGLNILYKLKKNAFFTYFENAHDLMVLIIIIQVVTYLYILPIEKNSYYLLGIYYCSQNARFQRGAQRSLIKSYYSCMRQNCVLKNAKISWNLITFNSVKKNQIFDVYLGIEDQINLSFFY